MHVRSTPRPPLQHRSRPTPSSGAQQAQSLTWSSGKAATGREEMKTDTRRARKERHPKGNAEEMEDRRKSKGKLRRGRRSGGPQTSLLQGCPRGVPALRVQASQKRPRDPQLAGLMSQETLRDQPRGLRIVRTCVPACTHTLSHTLVCTHAHTLTLTSTHASTHVQLRTHPRIYAHTRRLRAYVHVSPHTCTHMHTLTYRHWHAQSPHECKSTRVDTHRHGHLHTCST